MADFFRGQSGGGGSSAMLDSWAALAAGGAGAPSSAAAAAAPLPPQQMQTQPSAADVVAELRRALSAQTERAQKLAEMLAAALALIENTQLAVADAAATTDRVAQRTASILRAIDASPYLSVLSAPQPPAPALPLPPPAIAAAVPPQLPPPAAPIVEVQPLSPPLRPAPAEDPAPKRAKVEKGGGVFAGAEDPALSGEKERVLGDLREHSDRKRSLWLLNAASAPELTRETVAQAMARFGAVDSVRAFPDVGVFVVLFRSSSSASAALEGFRHGDVRAYQPSKDLWISGRRLSSEEVEAVVGRFGAVDSNHAHSEYAHVVLDATTSAMGVVLFASNGILLRDRQRVLVSFRRHGEESPPSFVLPPGSTGGNNSFHRSPSPIPAEQQPPMLAPKQTGNPPSHTLWIGNVPHGATEPQVRSLLERFHPVSIEMRQPATGMFGSSFVFVKFGSTEEAAVAKFQLGVPKLLGSPLNVHFASKPLGPTEELPLPVVVVRPGIQDAARVFSEFGNIVSIRESPGRDGLEISYSMVESAILARAMLNKKIFNGKELSVTYVAR